MSNHYSSTKPKKAFDHDPVDPLGDYIADHYKEFPPIPPEEKSAQTKKERGSLLRTRADDDMGGPAGSLQDSLKFWAVVLLVGFVLIKCSG